VTHVIKKLILVAVVGFVAVTALKGTKLVSYLRSEAHGLKQWAEDQVPPEKEVARLKHELRLLEQRDLPAAAEEWSKAENQLDQLDKQIAELRTEKTRLAAAKDKRAEDIRKAQAAAKDSPDAGYVSSGDTRVPVSAALRELKRDVEAYNKTADTLDAAEAARSDWAMLERERKETFLTMQGQVKEIGRDLALLEAQVERMKAEQMRSRTPTDTSRMSKIKQSANELRNKMDVQKRTAAKLQGAKDSAETETVDQILARARK
jgi:hypothetical protein